MPVCAGSPRCTRATAQWVEGKVGQERFCFECKDAAVLVSIHGLFEATAARVQQPGGGAEAASSAVLLLDALKRIFASKVRPPPLPPSPRS